MTQKVFGNYKCICEREFDNNQSFNGHKSHCKIHQLNKYGSLDKLNATTQKSLDNIHRANKEQYEKRVKAQEETWISEQHTCEHCDKVMTEKFGSGRFCSRACANSREFSDESKKKKSDIAKNKKPFFNKNGEVKYFFEDEVPEGWVYGNLSLVKAKEDWLAGDIHYSKSSAKTYRKEYAEDTKAIRKKKQELLLKKKEDYLCQVQSKNKEVLKYYLSLLVEKANGRIYQIPENCLPYGKYLSVNMSNHPRTKKYSTSRVHVHILMAEELLGRYLTDDEVVHHINEDKYDNRFDNIIIFDSKASHARFHNTDEYILEIDEDRLVCNKLIYPKFEISSKDIS